MLTKTFETRYYRKDISRSPVLTYLYNNSSKKQKNHSGGENSIIKMLLEENDYSGNPNSGNFNIGNFNTGNFNTGKR
jgi:hypothetical protein